jgi:hypothetical protein
MDTASIAKPEFFQPGPEANRIHLVRKFQDQMRISPVPSWRVMWEDSFSKHQTIRAMIMKTMLPPSHSVLQDLLVFSLALAWTVETTPRAAAGLLAYEGFDYAAGTSLVGQNGGLGFTNAWQANGSPNTAPGFSAIIQAAGLSYKDSKGNTLVTAGGSALFTGQYGTAQPTRDFLGRGTDGTTTWISFIGDRQGPTTNNTGTPFNPYPRGSSLAFFTSGERFSVGSASGATNGNWYLTPTGTAASGVPTTTPISQQSLLVVRVDYLAGNDNAYLFVNPDLTTEPLIGNASATLLGVTDLSFYRLRPFAGASDAANGRPYADFVMDEIRIGDTFRDVTPFVAVPEPSVLVLSLIGLAVAIGRRVCRPE